MARSRKAMLEAARDLLVREGPAGVTHQRVAVQAGVGRATVYRHWPRTDQLLLDAMSLVDFPFFRDPVTPVRPWLRGQLRVLADEMALPPVAAIALAMMRGSAGSLPAEVGDRFRATGTNGIGAALALAVAAGELDGAPGPQDAAALLVGPILQRTCMEGGTVSDDLIERIIDSVGSWRPGQTGGLSRPPGGGDLRLGGPLLDELGGEVTVGTRGAAEPVGEVLQAGWCGDEPLLLEVGHHVLQGFRVPQGCLRAATRDIPHDGGY